VKRLLNGIFSQSDTFLGQGPSTQTECIKIISHCDLRAFRNFGDSQPAFLAGPCIGMITIIGDWVRPSLPILTISREWKIIDCSHFSPLCALSAFSIRPIFVRQKCTVEASDENAYFHIFTIYLTRLFWNVSMFAVSIRHMNNRRINEISIKLKQ
jgi:hypothetical protein